MPFPHAGQNIVEIELETAPGELTPANNRAVIAAEGVRENLRVLLVSGEPHAGERTWRNLLKSDAAVDLVHFTILRPPQKQDGTPIHQLSLIAFPTRELFSEKINDFDLIIFDRYQHRDILQLLYYENIARYVEQGGALLVAAGDDFAGEMSLSRTPLSVVLPATPTGRLLEQPFKARLSGDGIKHPVTRGLPGTERRSRQGPDLGPLVPPGRRGADPRPHGHERRREPPAAGARPQGSRPRRAAAVRPRLAVGARLRRRRTAHRPAAPPLALADEGAGPRGGAADRLRQRPQAHDRAPLHGGQRAAGAGVGARRRDSEVTLDKAGPGSWRSTIDVKVPGLYKMQTQSATGQLHAVAHAGIEDAREMSEVTATDDKMKPLVDATGGGMFWTRGGGLLSSVSASSVELPRISMLANARVLAGSGWLGLKDREAYVTRGVKLIPMFTGLLALAALLALLALTWWREGR